MENEEKKSKLADIFQIIFLSIMGLFLMGSLFNLQVQETEVNNYMKEKTNEAERIEQQLLELQIEQNEILRTLIY